MNVNKGAFFAYLTQFSASGKEFGPRTSSAILPQLIGLAQAQTVEGALIWGTAICGI